MKLPGLLGIGATQQYSPEFSRDILLTSISWDGFWGYLSIQGQNAQNFQGFESLILSDAENAKKRRQFPSNMAVGQKAQISL